MKAKELERLTAEMNSSGKSGAGTGSAAKSSRPVREKKLKFTFNEKREYETIDGDIAALEEKIARLNEEMSQTADDYVRLQELSQEQEKLETDLEQKMDRWVYLNDLAEQIENQK